MKLHCFQLANNLNRILTFYYYFISMHTQRQEASKDIQGPQDVACPASCLTLCSWGLDFWQMAAKAGIFLN